MRDLQVKLIQSDLIWENPEASRNHFDQHLSTIAEPTNLVVLPEMFTTGFSMSPQRVAEDFSSGNMTSLDWMRGWAAKLNAFVTGSIAVSENGKYFNRLFWVRPDGSFSTYDKRHLFQMAGENQHYTPGSQLLNEDLYGWKICPLICYDLRFPVWSRNKLVDGNPLYDVLIYSANWPEVRRQPWNKLLPARAIENQCYVLAVNRSGTDGNNLPYSGDSAVIDPRGEYVFGPANPTEQIISATISYLELVDFRSKFPVLTDADQFNLEH